MRRNLLLLFLLVIPLIFASKYTASVFAQTPMPTPVHPSPPYTPPLNPTSYPCARSYLNSFHPLRPYPANPCDPYIPQKKPEAPKDIPNNLYLTFMCSPSAEPQGIYTITGGDVVDISGFTTYPGYSQAVLDKRYFCPGSVNEICFNHLVIFDVALNYSESQLPVMGNTQNYLSDVEKINNYLSYYLNGTVQQAANPKEADNPQNNPDSIYRLENFSGPLKKLLSYTSQKTLRDTLQHGNYGMQYHNYQINGAGRISSTSTTNPNFPFSSLEDITSEATIAIPSSQPGTGDGVVIPGTVSLTIGSADSRLYFPHMRNTNALSDILASVSRPKFVYDKGTTVVSADSKPLVTQNIDRHQGLNPGDDTPVQTTDYRTAWMAPNNNTRNTEIIEGKAAPPRLYQSSATCNMTMTSNPGDDLVGSTINTRLSFIMMFRYTPQLTIGNPCPAGSFNCVNKPCAFGGNACNPAQADSCCYDTCVDTPPGQCTYNGTGDPGLCDYVSCSSLDASTCTVGTAGACCTWYKETPTCPAWPNKQLRTAGRIAVYTKTPLIERIYSTLVASSSSILRRFLPEDAATGSAIKTNRDETIPGGTTAKYTATSPDLSSVSVGGGNGLYFAHLGSLFNYFLGNGGISSNLNLQCMFRPRGSCTVPLQCPADVLDKLPSVDPACGVCNSDLGPLAQRILGAAGQTFNVSAADIWTTMWHEGATWPEYAGQFTDENVRKWSIPESCGGAPMPKCDNQADATQPPFGWIKYYFYEDSDAMWKAVQQIDPSRDTKDKVSRCNFLDAAYATAKALSRQAASHVGQSCGAYTFTDTVIPNSCDWTDTKFAQSQMGYGGQCPDGPILYPPKPPYDIKDLVDMYHGYKCN